MSARRVASLSISVSARGRASCLGPAKYFKHVRGHLHLLASSLPTRSPSPRGLPSGNIRGEVVAMAGNTALMPGWSALAQLTEIALCSPSWQRRTTPLCMALVLFGRLRRLPGGRISDPAHSSEVDERLSRNVQNSSKYCTYPADPGAQLLDGGWSLTYYIYQGDHPAPPHLVSSLTLISVFIFCLPGTALPLRLRSFFAAQLLWRESPGFRNRH